MRKEWGSALKYLTEASQKSHPGGGELFGDDSIGYELSVGDDEALRILLATRQIAIRLA